MRPKRLSTRIEVSLQALFAAQLGTQKPGRIRKKPAKWLKFIAEVPQLNRPECRGQKKECRAAPGGLTVFPGWIIQVGRSANGGERGLGQDGELATRLVVTDAGVPRTSAA